MKLAALIAKGVATVMAWEALLTTVLTVSL